MQTKFPFFSLPQLHTGFTGLISGIPGEFYRKDYQDLHYNESNIPVSLMC